MKGRALTAVVGLGIAMLAVGALSNQRGTASTATSRPAVVAVDDLTPAGGARSLDATIASLQEQVAQRPTDAKAKAQLGLAYLQKGRLSVDPSYFPKAETLFQQALDLDESFEALVGQGLVANARHRFSEGIEWGRQARLVNRYSAAPLGVIADSQIELGDYAGAQKTIQKMVDLRPDLSSLARVSYIRELTGDTAGAIDAMRMALRATDPGGEDASWARTQIGDLYFSLGDVTAAERIYGTASKIAPDYHVAEIGVAKVLAAQGRYDDAIAVMEPVADVYPTPQNVITLGDLYVAAGRDSEAEDAYELVEVQRKLFATSGVLPDVELTLFYADQGLGAVKLAHAQYRERQSVRTADALAWALHAAGRDGAALTYSSEALRLGTRDASYHYHRGAILQSLGKKSQAIAQLRLALRMNPHFSILGPAHAKAALEELAR